LSVELSDILYFQRTTQKFVQLVENYRVIVLSK